MDATELRLMFVAGLFVLGGLAVLMGWALSSLTERWRSYRVGAGHAAARRSDTHAQPGDEKRAVLFRQAR
jgi:hypothetical protein